MVSKAATITHKDDTINQLKAALDSKDETISQTKKSLTLNKKILTQVQSESTHKDQRITDLANKEESVIAIQRWMSNHGMQCSFS